VTEEEHIKLVEIGNSFWKKLGILAAEHIAQLPEHMEEETTMYLQDKCSIYSTRYSEHLALIRKMSK
jgi:hypothetical protein